MARIDERTFKQYTDGRDRMTAVDYQRDREIFRMGINDLEDKYEVVEGIQTQYTNVNSALNTGLQRLETTSQTLQSEVARATSTLESISIEAREIVTDIDSRLLTVLSQVSVVNGQLYWNGSPINPGQPIDPGPTNPGPTDPGTGNPPVDPPISTGTFGLIGKWFDDIMSGQTVYSTHYPGSSIRATITGTTKIGGLFQYTGAGWTEPPIVAIRTRVNGGAFSGWTKKVLNADTLDLATSLTAGSSYEIEFVFDGWNQTDNLWGNQRKFTFKGFSVDSGATVTYNNTQKNILVVGDSITAGTKSASNTDLAAGSSAVLSFSRFLADRLGVNLFRSAFPGTKVIDTFTRQNVLQVTNGRNVPNYSIHTIIIEMGTNDYQKTSAEFISNYQLIIDALRTIYPTQRIYIVGLFEAQVGIRRNEELAALAASNQRVTHIDTAALTGVVYTDGLHPDGTGGLAISNYIYPKLVADGWETGGGQAVPEPPPGSNIPDGNLWVLGGQPASFNPLPAGWISIPFPGSYGGPTNRFRVTFKGRSAKGGKVTVYTEYKNDFGEHVTQLTNTLTSYSYEFTCTYTGDGNFFFFKRNNFDADSDSDIILQDISIVKI